MAKALEQKRLSFLEDGLNYFNSNTRCVNNGGTCVYSPIEGKSKGCFIGRAVQLEKALELERLFSSMGVNVDKVFNILPKEMRDLGKDFLTACQSLHDTEYYWNELGLSEYGTEKVENIKQVYCG